MASVRHAAKLESANLKLGQNDENTIKSAVDRSLLMAQNLKTWHRNSA